MNKEHSQPRPPQSSTSLHPKLAGLEKAPMNASSEQHRLYRILCVDDERIGSKIRGEILTEHGYFVVLYHCPLAVLHCDFSIFDLAVIDFQMPGLNGRELFLRMRALGAKFPIVLLTGCMNALSYEDLVLFARCIDKGMPIQHLLETVAEFLDPNQVPDCGT
jgi:CheY-like chemotaxis protein